MCVYIYIYISLIKGALESTGKLKSRRARGAPGESRSSTGLLLSGDGARARRDPLERFRLIGFIGFIGLIGFIGFIGLIGLIGFIGV